MQTESVWHSRLVQTIVVIVLALVALVTALLVVPQLALWLGLLDRHIGYVTAAAAFLIVFVAARRVKSLNQKPAGKTGKAPRKR